MTKRVAIYLQDAHDLREGLDIVRYAEEKGFEAVWQAESRLVRDAIVPMAAYSAVTEKIKVGSGVINNWTRNIGLLASTFLTLDDLAPNRIICGIGAWWDPLAKNVGINRTKPLKAMEETVTILRRLLNMERVTFEGEFVNVHGIELDVVHGRREPRNVPIYIGATGDKMMEMAKGYCAIVVKNSDGRVIGYALLRPHHFANTCKRTSELTYFLLPEYTRQGIGKAILDHLIGEAKRLGIDNLTASVSSLNEVSIAFHRKNGFHECGCIRQVGRKFGQDFDVIWFQRRLTD